MVDCTTHSDSQIAPAYSQRRRNDYRYHWSGSPSDVSSASPACLLGWSRVRAGCDVANLLVGEQPSAPTELGHDRFQRPLDAGSVRVESEFGQLVPHREGPADLGDGDADVAS